jgi:hypothetical protein
VSELEFQRGTRAQTRQRIFVTRDHLVKSDSGYEFRPTTTVHDVALIPGYFSSGEEEMEAKQQRESGQRNSVRVVPGYQNIYKTPTTNTNFA